MAHLTNSQWNTLESEVAEQALRTLYDIMRNGHVDYKVPAVLAYVEYLKVTRKD